MEKNYNFINKNFLYIEKNYKNIQEFNEDLLNINLDSESLSQNISDEKDKFQWDIEANYKDQEIVERYPMSLQPKEKNIRFQRKFTYYVINRTNSTILTTYTRIEKGLLESPSKTRFVSGIYSLKFIKKKNLEYAIEARFGDEEGRIEVYDLNKDI